VPVANRTCPCVTHSPTGTQTLVREHRRAFALPGAKRGCSSEAQARVPGHKCLSSHRVSDHCEHFVATAAVIVNK
jgi:hypothetical protein